MEENDRAVADAAGQLKWLTPDNVGAVLKGLPFKVRTALRAAAHLPRGSLTITTPDRQTFKVVGKESGPEAALILHNWNLPRRAFSGGTIGVAESYMDGDWDSPDVTTFLELFVVNEQIGEKLAGGMNWLANSLQRVRHWMNENTPSRSRRNISAHYDLGNSFYREWLDPTMTYSSALYSEGANDLESAQTAKYRALARNIGITPGSSVLEIGCGWGGFAEFAAREIGARVTGLTISREQYAYATERIAKAGLAGKVDIKFQDYRDETGRYDHIASIEMFEAVGEKYWPVFFGKVRDCLKPGGSAGMQIITINDESFDRYRKRPDFIQRYVFPGGMLPTPSKLKSLGKEFGLDLYRENVFAQDYARTLAEWRDRFWNSWDRLRHLGFDGRFKKLWEFYLFYCEAGFRSEYIDVRQVFYKA
ncbi:cyclopropane-fatty-acyl-phospholipid synthase [Phyllobacterium sp. 0TCS1.6C]|uniref:SAM-dependent methyltransferase n=1 Tax=unclassified Phyllobacterium TaxID=2638441 RepID=UPI0022643F0F|nr:MULTISPECIES: cyclopropane-fatty-acyl-phospholipid synthase family protein [unclassified Phyllobacterium]MCX8282420.1 cyclopropane-fatty-acyl-phospholipid synthase [Phyllobacterium sp. 0TCS1.6C]MCX8292512.1 cyclopropane-fatty-acyl-phospholipid synthase [Phyllobacterium sp. 0TCS1.6A]